MIQSESIDELAKALAKAQGQISSAIKERENPAFKSKYADLAAVWKACREPLTKEGLSVIQTTKRDGENVVLVTTLLHSSGQWIRGEMPLDYPKEDLIEKNQYGKEFRRNYLQVMSSAFTYVRRVTLSALVGVAPDDDDDAQSCSMPKKRDTPKEPVETEKTNTIKEMSPTQKTKTYETELNQFIIDNNLNDANSDMFQYLKMLAKKKSMTINEMIEYCFENRHGFFKAFKQYQDEVKKRLEEENNKPPTT